MKFLAVPSNLFILDGEHIYNWKEFYSDESESMDSLARRAQSNDIVFLIRRDNWRHPSRNRLTWKAPRMNRMDIPKEMPTAALSGTSWVMASLFSHTQRGRERERERKLTKKSAHVTKRPTYIAGPWVSRKLGYGESKEGRHEGEWKLAVSVNCNGREREQETAEWRGSQR
ncbi:hypothetical protein VTK73DRAFT_10371 [Phialemonium thermophilum]|uniref:Uncharacterized protein n=1 Tax=Phialemonium thermophilum TaxID=223376 RepID=A0ABR3VX33_9PEZI